MAGVQVQLMMSTWSLSLSKIWLELGIDVVVSAYTQPFYCPLGFLSGTTRVSRHQKGKASLDLLDQEIVSSSGISWAICKYAP